MKETRSQLIWRHVSRFISHSGYSWPTYATEVREHYHQRTPEHRRLVAFSPRGDAHTRARRDAQIIRRFQHEYEHAIHDYDIPADLEEAMVLALNSLGYDGFDRLLTELAQRYGLLAAAIPLGTVADDTGHISAVLRETADVVDAAAPLLDDGRIDGNDDQTKLRALQVEAREAMARLATVDRMATEALGGPDPACGSGLRSVK